MLLFFLPYACCFRLPLFNYGKRGPEAALLPSLVYHTKENPTKTQERENNTPTPWGEASNCALQFGTGLTICEDYALEKGTGETIPIPGLYLPIVDRRL